MEPRPDPDDKIHVKRPRGVIFDYGNTLVRLDPGVHSTRTDYADVVARPGATRLAAHLVCTGILGAPDTPAFVDRFLDVRERNRDEAERAGREIPALASLRQALAASGVTAGSDADMERALQEFFLPEVELMRPMPGAGELLDAVREKGIRLALLSNATSGRYIEEVIRRMGWSGLFDPFVVSADIGVRKPRPEAFRAVLGRMSFEPGEIMMVGDSLYHDVEGAQALGLITVHLTAIPNSFDSKAAPSRYPSYSVSSLEEIHRLLS
jgi:HAD superfamily hydrolase (TIGR01509 family)